MTVSNIQKTLLLIGPGEHFGPHIIRKFAAEGYLVGIISQNQEKLTRLTDLLELQNIKIATAPADVKNFVEVKNAVDLLANSLPEISCVIFNVKKSSRGSCLTVDSQEFSDALVTNVGGAINSLKAVVPYLKNSTMPSLILTGGGYKDNPDPEKLALSVSKAALHGVYLAAKEVLRKNDILLKTIVIDGMVRADGPIFPSDVANIFWEAHVDRNRSEFYCR